MMPHINCHVLSLITSSGDIFCVPFDLYLVGSAVVTEENHGASVVTRDPCHGHRATFFKFGARFLNDVCDFHRWLEFQITTPVTIFQLHNENL